MPEELQAERVLQARAEFAAMADAWRVVSARSARRARQSAEVQVFNQMVVALAGRFDEVEGPGFPRPGAREVRLLAQGVAADGRFPSATGWRADASVTGYRAGDRIALSEVVFSRLAEVFFDGLVRQFA